MAGKPRSRRPQKALEIIRGLASHLEEIILLVDAAGNVRVANESACDQLGVLAQDLVGIPFSALTNDRETSEQLLQQARGAVDPLYSKMELLRKDGSALPVVVCLQRTSTLRDLIQVIAKPVRPALPRSDIAGKILDLEEKISRLQISLSNMGARLSEKTIQLAEERNKSMAVITNMADGLVVLDPSGKVSQINPMTRDLFGIEDDGPLGKPFAVALPDLAAAVAKAQEAEESSESSTLSRDVKCEIRDKTIQALRTTLKDETEATAGEVIVLRDITREEELARMREELISIVSHELRSPLTMITGYMALILRGEVGEINPEQREFLEIAARNGERLTRLINDLLDLSRLTSGLTTLNIGRLDALYLVDLTYYNFHKTAEEKGLEIVKETPEGPLYVCGDDTRLVQVMTNLVSNAIKFTPKGGRIFLRADKVPSGVRLKVADTGMGISQEECRKVFDKFFRSKDVAKRKISGTGLGLPICEAIVRAHDSEIHVKSKEGEGASFSFLLRDWSDSESIETSLPHDTD